MMRFVNVLAVVALLLANGGVAGILRFSCSQLVVDRLDPLVNPGQLPSPHLHQVVGGVGSCLFLKIPELTFET